MSGLASGQIQGRLTRDAELKYTNGGSAVCHFSIATSRKIKKGTEYVEESSFWDCVLWGKQGESLNQYLTKGTKVTVSGEIYQQRWETDGQQRMKVELNVNQFDFAESRKEGQGDTQTAQGRDSPERVAARAARAQEPSKAADADMFSDDIPF